MKSNWKRTALIGAIALALAGGIAALAIFVIAPAARYGRAGRLAAAGDAAGAYEAYDRMGDYRDARARMRQLQADILGARGAEPTEFAGYTWLVLERREDKALLLMESVLEMRPFHEALLDTSWETCTLRLWLNGAFYESLPKADRARVAETAVRNSGNAQYGVKPSGETTDRVFLLSLEEAKLYFPDAAGRIARYNGAAAYWWLRSPGLEPYLAAIVGSDGLPGYAGSPVSAGSRGLRPALWAAPE